MSLGMTHFDQFSTITTAAGHPYNHSNIITPKLHQSQEYE
jgi:hypothetical protein